MMFKAVRKCDILVRRSNLEIPILKPITVFGARSFIIATIILGREATEKIIAVRVTVRIPCHLNCPLLRLDVRLASIR
jgi:hypothetical protein